MNDIKTEFIQFDAFRTYCNLMRKTYKMHKHKELEEDYKFIVDIMDNYIEWLMQDDKEKID